MPGEDRDVKSLVASHEAGITALKRALSQCDSALSDDDVYLLRFLLSADGDVAAAAEAVRQTLAWRKEKADLLQAAKPGSPPPPLYEVFSKFVATGVHGKTKDGDVIFVVRAGLANSKAILAELSPEHVLDFMLFNREKVFLQMDELTKSSGRLCKAVTVTDMNFASLSKMNRQFSQLLTKASKLSEIYFPQFLDTAVLINVPTVMKAVMRALWGLMPKKFQQKLKVCPGRTLTQDISKCPFASARLTAASVPTFLGGGCSCPRGCIAGLANDQRESNVEEDPETGLSKWTIPTRESYEVFLDVEAGATLSYQCQVDKGNKLSSGPVTLTALLRGDGKESTLLAPRSVTPEDGLVQGSVQCPGAGTCVFVWTNANAVFSRGIRYSILDASAAHELSELSVKDDC